MSQSVKCQVCRVLCAGMLLQQPLHCQRCHHSFNLDIESLHCVQLTHITNNWPSPRTTHHSLSLSSAFILATRRLRKDTDMHTDIEVLLTNTLVLATAAAAAVAASAIGKEMTQ